MAVDHLSKEVFQQEPEWLPWAEKPPLPQMHLKEFLEKFGTVSREKQER